MDSAASARTPNGRFRLEDVIPRARSLIKGSKRQMLLLFLVSSLTIGVSTFVAALVTPPDDPLPLALDVTTALITTVFSLAYTTLGLQRAAGQAITVGGAFRYFERLPHALLVYLPVYLLQTQIGAAIGPFWMLLVSLALAPTLFVPHFLIDREAGALEAVGCAYRLALDNLGQLLLFWLLMVGLALASMLTLGIGLVWVMPFGIIATAVMYQEAEGLQREYGA